METFKDYYDVLSEKASNSGIELLNEPELREIPLIFSLEEAEED